MIRTTPRALAAAALLALTLTACGRADADTPTTGTDTEPAVPAGIVLEEHGNELVIVTFEDGDHVTVERPPGATGCGPGDRTPGCLRAP